MKISDAITALEACLDAFGDVECSFTTSADGNPAVELKNVDTTKKPDIKIDYESEEWAQAEEAARRFNLRFPTKDLYIPFKN